MGEVEANVQVWPELREYSNVRLSPDQRYVAAIGFRRIDVFSLRLDRTVGQKVWSTSDLTGQFPLGYAWCGQNLVFSSIETPGKKDVRAISPQELGKIRETTGLTHRLYLPSGKLEVLMQEAYLSIQSNPNGKWIFLTYPTGIKAKDAYFKFVALDAVNGVVAAHSVGSPATQIIPASGIPQFLGWAPNEVAVFLVKETLNSKRLGRINELWKLDKDGHTFQLTGEVDSVCPSSSYQYPTFVSDGTKTPYFVIKFNNRVRYLCTFEGTNIKKVKSLKEIEDSVRDILPHPEFISVTPSGRFVVLQNVKFRQDNDDEATDFRVTQPNDAADYWLLDLDLMRIRMLGQGFPMGSVMPWIAEVLPFTHLVFDSVKDKVHYNNGLIEVPEAKYDSDSPQLKTTTKSREWKDLNLTKKELP